MRSHERGRSTTGWLYSVGMTHRVGAKGQVVIPKELRDRAGIYPGTEVEFELENGHIVVKPLRRTSTLGGRFRGSDMAAKLLEDRAREPR
jgi:antitoxin PrlF